MKFNPINIPKQVFEIVKILNENNYEGFIVGGSVRDMMLGKTPKDFDLTTNAVPEEVVKMFEKEDFRVIPTGIKFGTVTVMMDGEPFEITTYRNEADYSDFRRPTAVSFSKNIAEDLKRRDFTCNALAFSPKTGQLVDLFGGIKDLENGIIRAVGNPNERFKEDALRLMRAVRFATRYGFRIEEKTKEAIKNHADKIRHVSIERVKTELDGILLSNKPSVGIRLLQELGILKIILPEVSILELVPQQSPWHNQNVFGHTLDALDGTPKRLDLLWTILLHDTGKKDARTRDETGRDRFIGHMEISGRIAEEILRRLKFDNASIKKIIKLINLHQEEPHKRNKMKHFLRRLGVENLQDFDDMRMADIKAHHPDKIDTGMEMLQQRRDLWNDILDKNEPYDIKHLAINGDDILALGIPQGEIVRKILKELLLLVINDPRKNTKEFLKRWVSKNWERLEKNEM